MLFARPWLRYLRLPYQPLINFVAAVDVVFTEIQPTRVAAGISFGRVRDLRYDFLLSSERGWALTERHGKDTREILSWRPAQVDLRQPVRMAVTVVEGAMTFSINDVVVGNFREASFSGGEIGLAITAGEPGLLIVEFDNFELRRPS